MPEHFQSFLHSFVRTNLKHFQSGSNQPGCNIPHCRSTLPHLPLHPFCMRFNLPHCRSNFLKLPLHPSHTAAQEWGVSLHTKGRKMQLVRMLWDEKTLRQPGGAQRSANMVARLAGEINMRIPRR